MMPVRLRAWALVVLFLGTGILTLALIGKTLEPMYGVYVAVMLFIAAHEAAKRGG